MQEAVAVREAALDAVDDVVPEPLREEIEQFVADGSLVPGVLTVLSARATGTNGAESDGDSDAVDVGGEVAADGAVDADGLAGRAAGVQLIYDGLRLTRRLVHAEPWTDAVDGAGVEADIEILAADVLVARGFYLLARTEAATVAVDVVRSFGRDQTERRDAADPAALDRELERDVLRLAVVAGVTTTGREPGDTDGLVGHLATSYDDGFPAPEELFDEAGRERVASVVGSAGRPVNRND